VAQKVKAMAAMVNCQKFAGLHTARVLA